MSPGLAASPAGSFRLAPPHPLPLAHGKRPDRRRSPPAPAPGRPDQTCSFPARPTPCPRHRLSPPHQNSPLALAAHQQIIIQSPDCPPPSIHPPEPAHHPVFTSRRRHRRLSRLHRKTPPSLARPVRLVRVPGPSPVRPACGGLVGPPPRAATRPLGGAQTGPPHGSTTQTSRWDIDVFGMSAAWPAREADPDQNLVHTATERINPPGTI